MQYILLFLILFFIELLYFRIADRYNIIDKPNIRSSHSNITLRGGGVLFPIALLLAFILGNVSLPFTLAVLLVGTISFIDDIRPLSQLPRFGSHVLASTLVIYDLNLFVYLFWLLPIVVIFIVGWINAFNFMDGINGMTVMYALTSIISFSFLPLNQTNLPLLIIMGLSCLAFGFFNIRTKAKTFAGDVGSISMALFLGYFMTKTILISGQFGYILFFSVYGLDVIITLMRRIGKKENIFEAHRTHLYQYLVNELRFSHLFIAFIYSALQIIINLLVIFLNEKKLLTMSVILGILFVLSLFNLSLRMIVERKIALKNKNLINHEYRKNNH